MKKKNKLLNISILFFVFLSLFSLVSASSVTTDRLNYYTSEQHTLSITNTGATANASATMPTGFTFVSSTTGCTNSSQTITCLNVNSTVPVSYIISSPVSNTEYELSVVNTTLGGSDLNNVSFLNINPSQIWNTLVEFSRGRGNYFFNSAGGSGSAGVGTGYNYVPNSTDFELNYLHKVYNIKQYFELASSRATDVTFSCIYPFHTVVREHMVSTISKNSTDWTVGYSLPRIDGSWERMGYLGMDFDSGEYNVADTFTINCTDLDYNLADAYGHIVVDEDSFSMEVRSPDALSVTAITSSSIGNGTSEVVITYTFTNDESYPVDSLMVEIDAPEEGTFIGVRGEIWGTSNDNYVTELPNLEAGETATLSLVARFDTSLSSDTTLLLTEGIKAKYIPTWELNAYNPMTYLQSLSPTDTISVNYGVSSIITSIQTQLDTIESTTTTINSTVNDIYALVQNINSSMLTLETADGQILTAINDSRNTILTAINSSSGVVINNLTSYISGALINVSVDSNEILNELEYMQGFNEELIFLVTDSVGLAEDSKVDFDNGDYQASMNKLTQAGEKLEEAQDEMFVQKKSVENDYKVQTSGGLTKIFHWFKGLFI